MSYAIGPLLFLSGIAMVFFGRPKGGRANWLMRAPFILELYSVAAISIIVLGICMAAFR